MSLRARVWIVTEDTHYHGSLNSLVVYPSLDDLDFGKGDDSVIVNASVPETEPSDAERLAIAVLQGRQEEALILADEVHLAFASKGRYRTREAILKEHDALLDYCEEMRKELARYRNVDARPSFSERAKYE